MEGTQSGAAGHGAEAMDVTCGFINGYGRWHSVGSRLECDEESWSDRGAVGTLWWHSVHVISGWHAPISTTFPGGRKMVKMVEMGAAGG